MRKAWILLTLVALLCSSSPAPAVIGTIDNVPAATLLLPYFEVDIGNASGVNTTFSINNASARAVLAHVTFWTDQSVPALRFDVYLTGYDVQTISLLDIFVNGTLPLTASSAQDPGDTISPRGPASQDVNFASCAALPYTNPAVSPLTRAHLQAWLQGNPSPVTGDCAGSKKRDNILRGYITVDAMNACHPYFVSDYPYFAQFLTDRNILWGDYSYIRPATNSAEGHPLVHIESCPSCFKPGDHTFYGRYNGGSADDGREPLPTTMSARYSTAGFWGRTDFQIWREANGAASAYNCALPGPSWYPLESAAIVFYDEEEHAVAANTCALGDPSCAQTRLIPNEAQRVNVATDLLTPFSFGWAKLVLQHQSLGPSYGDQNAQMWLTTSMLGGNFGVGLDAVQLDNANSPCAATCQPGSGSCNVSCGF